MLDELVEGLELVGQNVTPLGLKEVGVEDVAIARKGGRTESVHDTDWIVNGGQGSKQDCPTPYSNFCGEALGRAAPLHRKNEKVCDRRRQQTPKGGAQKPQQMPALALALTPSSLSSLSSLFVLLAAAASTPAKSAPVTHCTLSSPVRNCTIHAISDCAPTSSVFQIRSQYFGPDPPVTGQNVTMWIEYAVPSSVTVTGGVSQDAVSLNGLPISTETSDLCNSVPCPQTAGVHNASNTFEWPSGLSRGSRMVYTTQWFDTQNTLLLCSKVSVTTA